MPWPSIRWTSAACISAPPADKCTVRRTLATPGRRLCAICRRCIRLRCRRYREVQGMIRVELPAHLRALARVKGEVTLEVTGAVCVLSILDALEAKYPMLE